LSQVVDIGEHESRASYHARKIMAGGRVEQEDVFALIEEDFYTLLYWANRLREHFFANKVYVCAIVNAKSGSCSEDCKFCAQSAHYKTNAPTYPFIGYDKIIEAAERAVSMGAKRFGIVTSGRCLTEEEFQNVLEAVRLLKEKFPLSLCASIGELSLQQAHLLREAGITRFNHNIETAPSYYENICTTHRIEDRLKTLKVLRDAGLEVCCGGILGMGEGWQERVEMAFALRELDVDVVPINFLHPIPGTPLGRSAPLSPSEALRAIALFRFVLPDKVIKVCGGREYVLGDFQSWIFLAGANGIIIGNYLTTKGRAAEDDLRMLEALGLEAV